MNLTSLISKSAKSLALLAMLAAMPMAASAEEMAKHLPLNSLMSHNWITNVIQTNIVRNVTNLTKLIKTKL